MNASRSWESSIRRLLKQYVNGQNEEDLYVGQQFSRQFIEKEISPEDVISIHKNALTDVFPDMPEKADTFV